MKVAIEMNSSASLLLAPRHFDGFLFAPVGDDEKGMTLTVLSALARLDFDPRQEAARLAGLPTQDARGELAAMIAKLPDVPSARSDPATIAGRLIALLPPKTFVRASVIALGRAPGLGASAIDVQSPRFLVSIALLAFLPLLIAAAFQAPPEGKSAMPIAGPVAPVSDQVSPQTSVNSYE